MLLKRFKMDRNSTACMLHVELQRTVGVTKLYVLKWHVEKKKSSVQKLIIYNVLHTRYVPFEGFP